MSHPAYDHKYSDRDVRENPDLRDLAIDYVNKYGGSFEPLLRIKLFLVDHNEEDLTTVQIRTVLNCMRHDPAVAADMPAPKFGFVQVQVRQARGAVVIPFQRDRRSQIIREESCSDPSPHNGHSFYVEGEPYKPWCKGIPFPINRHRRAATSGRIRGRHFAATKSGSLVHRITGEATFAWEPNAHDWGFKEEPVSISVKTMCKNPSWIHGGFLFEEEPVHLYADEVFAKERCPRCFTVQELREGPPPAKLGIPQVVFQSPEES